MSTARYRSFLRIMYTSAVASRLTAGELRVLADELRRGQLADELAYMLARAAEHFGELEEEVADNGRIMEAEQLVRRNKISKIALISILESLGYASLGTKESSRDMIRRFINNASSSKISKLMDVLKSKQLGDNFLTGISEGRK